MASAPVGMALVWAAASACSSSSSSSSGGPATQGERANDPGCKVIGETPPPGGGHSLGEVHEATAVDAGEDASADASADSSPDPSADASAAVVIAPESVRTVACREGTTLDVAAGPNGAVSVVGAGIRGQMITFSSGPPTTRVLEYLRTSGAAAGIATLPDGRPFVVGTAEGGLVTEEGTDGPRPLSSPTGTVVFGRAAPNALGAFLMTTSSEEALVRGAGEPRVVSLPPGPSTQLDTAQSVVGLGDDEQPYRVTVGASIAAWSVAIGDRTWPLGALGSLRGIAFTTLGATEPRPALALLHGPASDPALNALDVALPSGTGYALVSVHPEPTPCHAQSACGDSCDEENAEINENEIATTWDGTTAYVVFVRRHVTRHRRYRIVQGSGIVCDLTGGCPPGCATESDGVTSSADLVIATIDLAAHTVRETFAQPLDQPGPGISPTVWMRDRVELAAQARDGFLHVTLRGKYQGTYPGVSVFRFRVAAPRR